MGIDFTLLWCLWLYSFGFSVILLLMAFLADIFSFLMGVFSGSIFLKARNVGVISLDFRFRKFDGGGSLLVSRVVEIRGNGVYLCIQ